MVVLPVTKAVSSGAAGPLQRGGHPWMFGCMHTTGCACVLLARPCTTRGDVFYVIGNNCMFASFTWRIALRG